MPASESSRSARHPHNRRAFLRDFGVLGLSASAAGLLLPRASSAQAPAQPKQGGTVVLASYQEAASLNWILIGSPSGLGFMQMYPMFEPSLRISEKLEPEPALLREVPTTQNGGISADGLTYTLRMRPGLKWSD